MIASALPLYVQVEIGWILATGTAAMGAARKKDSVAALEDSVASEELPCIGVCVRGVGLVAQQTYMGGIASLHLGTSFQKTTETSTRACMHFLVHTFHSPGVKLRLLVRLEKILFSSGPSFSFGFLHRTWTHVSCV